MGSEMCIRDSMWGNGTTLTRALSNVPLRAGLTGDALVKERQLWVTIETARKATAALLAAKPVKQLGAEDGEGNLDSAQGGGKADSDDEPAPVLVPLYPWAVSEKMHREFINIYGVTHGLAWNLGQGEAAIAFIRGKKQFVGLAVNAVARDAACEHVKSVMLEEHLLSANDGFLFRKTLRTQASLGGGSDDHQGNHSSAGSRGTKRRREDGTGNKAESSQSAKSGENNAASSKPAKPGKSNAGKYESVSLPDSASADSDSESSDVQAE